MIKYVVVYCYEQVKMDGIVQRIVTEGIYSTYEEAEEAEQSVWDRFEGKEREKRPSYLFDVSVIEVDFELP